MGKKEKDNEDEDEKETEKKDADPEDEVEEEEEEDVDMKEAEQMGPNGNVIGNAVCAEAMILPDHNDNDADDEDEDDEDNEVEAPEQTEETEETEKTEKAEKVEEDEKEEADDEEEDEDEDDDDDLTPADRCASASVGRRSRRVTPILHNVVFNTDLMHNKVPILRKSEEREAVNAVMGPVFLNEDEYDELYPKEGRRDSHSNSNSKQAQTVK